jgi:hypothetical protein
MVAIHGARRAACLVGRSVGWIMGVVVMPVIAVAAVSTISVPTGLRRSRWQ